MRGPSRDLSRTETWVPPTRGRDRARSHNRRQDRVKLLGWSRNGFWLLHKRLESERFIWPREDARVIQLTVQQLHWLLEGIDLAAMRGHEIIRYKRAA